MFDYGYKQLDEVQKEVVQECLGKLHGGGLCLNVGFGKTIIAIVLGLYYQEQAHSLEPFLVVVSKTLLGSWKNEIDKFFHGTLKFTVLHQDECNLETYQLPDDVRMVVTTSQVVAKYYQLNHIDAMFKVDQQAFRQGRMVQLSRYNVPYQPFYQTDYGANMIFARKWSSLFVDEVHCYTNINTLVCQGIGAICSPIRWALSGEQSSSMVL